MKKHCKINRPKKAYRINIPWKRQSQKVLHHIYNANNAILEKLKKGLLFNKIEKRYLNNLHATYLICYLNLFHDAIDKLNEAKPYLKNHNEELFQLYKESIRILRKVKYS